MTEFEEELITQLKYMNSKQYEYADALIEQFIKLNNNLDNLNTKLDDSNDKLDALACTIFEMGNHFKVHDENSEEDHAYLSITELIHDKFAYTSSLIENHLESIAQDISYIRKEGLLVDNSQ
jgi:seryl-tRNA synthetase